MRYLWHAFFARPDIPLLRLPWNAMAMVAAGVAGWWEPAVWLTAGVGEMVYLFTIASNPGFQRWIDEKRLAIVRGDTEDARHQLLSKVGGAARQRYKKLEDKRQKLDALYRQNAGDDLLLDTNLGALQKLTWLFLNLLVAQRDLLVSPSSDRKDLQKEIDALERELPHAQEPVLTSKKARLKLLRDRMDNIGTKERSLVEIEADLARIETQIDVALEEASLRGRPVALSSHIELTSHLLTNMDDETTYARREVE